MNDEECLISPLPEMAAFQLFGRGRFRLKFLGRQGGFVR
jgi:hypothetical protein